MRIEICGLGCENCRRLESNARAAIKDLGISAEVIKIEDFEELVRRGIKFTPGLVVDGKIVSMGRLLTVDTIKEILGRGDGPKGTAEMSVLDVTDRCGCTSVGTMIYPCSGGSNVGQISNEAAKLLAGNGKGKFSCLAGIGAHGSSFMESARKAAGIIAIDGCGSHCALKTLLNADIQPSAHFVVTDIGVKKDYNLCPRKEDIQALVDLIEGSAGG